MTPFEYITEYLSIIFGAIVLLIAALLFAASLAVAVILSIQYVAQWISIKGGDA